VTATSLFVLAATSFSNSDMIRSMRFRPVEKLQVKKAETTTPTGELGGLAS
jgi:hypothetical protein